MNLTQIPATILFFCVECLLIFPVGAQSNQTPNMNGRPAKNIMTDVFLLDTRDPSTLSFIKVSGDRVDTVRNSGRLEMAARHLSAFKIININSLRYNYYINNQLVTTFTDANPITGASATFINGSGLPVNDINSIEILGSGKENLNQKVQLIGLQNEINTALNALQKLKRKERNLSGQYGTLLVKKYDERKTPKRDTVTQQLEKLRQQLDDMENEITENTDSLSQKVSNYQIAIAAMNINSKNQTILQDIYKRYSNFTGVIVDPNSLFATANQIGFQAGAYLNLTSNFDSAQFLYDSLVQSAPTVEVNAYRTFRADTNRRSFDVVQRQTLNRLLHKLTEIGYYSQYLSDVQKINRYDPTFLLIEGFRFKEFITTKKFDELEGFILTTCEEMAKLLQNKYVEFSRDLNTIKGMDFIAPDYLDKVGSWTEELVQIFGFIQDMKSDFIVLTQYLSIDNSNFKEILSSITTNYVQLLNFLKNFDYIRQANTTQDFTLPTSTNLGNIDVVRYNVERDEKGTSGKQTYTYDIWLRGGLKVDFSAGLFCSGLSDNTYNKVQLLRADNNIVTGDTFGIKKQDAGTFSFAFGGMVNIYPRLGGSWVTGGASVGVAYANNQKLQVLIGGSLHFGKTERLVLHGGFAMGTVKRLDISAFPYTYDGNSKVYVVRGEMSSFNIPTNDKFIARPFIGLTYNLSKKNALTAVSEPGLDKYNSAMQGGSTK